MTQSIVLGYSDTIGKGWTVRSYSAWWMLFYMDKLNTVLAYYVIVCVWTKGPCI